MGPIQVTEEDNGASLEGHGHLSYQVPRRDDSRKPNTPVNMNVIVPFKAILPHFII